MHLEVEGKSFVIDTGPDFRQQMLRERIARLNAVIFTHAHKDHTAGMDDVRAFNFRQKKPMPIYGEPLVFDQLKMEFSYVFADKKYPGVPQIEPVAINHPERFEIEGVTFQPIRVMHLHLPVLGFRINDFTYITDANYIHDEEKEKIKGSKALVVNALQRDKHLSHFNLEQAVALAEELGAGHTYFTHISHKLGLHKEVEKELPDHITLAYDGLSVAL